jgi:hypothetical protein
MSSCAFLGAQILNLTPWMYSMAQIYFHGLLLCPNPILWSRKLWPSEVNWVSKFTLHYLACNFLILALFDEQFTPLETSLQAISFELNIVIFREKILFYVDLAIVLTFWVHFIP